MNGSIVSLVTPFDVENKIDYEKLFKIIDFQINNGTDGLLLLGPESESESLTKEERINLVKKCTKYIGDKVKIVVGVLGNSIQDTLDFTKNISEEDFDYLLIGLPMLLNSNEVGIMSYFTYIADNNSKPIIIYNNDKIFDSNVINKLSYHKNIFGIVEAGKCIERLIDLSFVSSENFKIYCGNDYLMMVSLSLGISGFVNIIGNVYPNEVKQIYDIFFKNPKKSLIVFNRIKKMINNIKLESCISSIKYLMTLKGIDVSKVRMPLGDCSKEIKRKIEEDYLIF